jgi:glycosyltransferase involved in cell wall biosynthesis
MRSVFYWEAGGLSLERANPYAGLLARSLAPLGVELEAGFARDLSAGWLRENRGRVDVLHLNWPHYMYNVPDLAGRVAACADLIGHLALARELGYQLVWTVHNLYPHESLHPDLDRLARLAITSLSTALIVHCRAAADLVAEHFHRREGVFVIPHGHFIEPYPNTCTRAEARQRMGIPEDRFVFVSFGNLKPYKGLDSLLEAFSALPGDDLVLLLALKTRDAYSVEMIERARRADPRIVIYTAQFFGVEEFQFFLNAADAAVMPFTQVLTSGTAITALSFGLPVIAPALGCLPELVDESMGILYEPDRPAALRGAMQTIRGRDLAPLREAAHRRAASLSWDGIARLTLEAYRHPASTGIRQVPPNEFGV